ncbi:MAG: serine/threonine-protein kinase [Polyangia bacterium]
MIGQLINHYKVVRKIGEGGMGSVWEGLHESIGRRVAIKVLRPGYSKDPKVVERFFNEAKAVNIVAHPGVVGSFDYGQLPDGTAYIIMEFLDGESLSARMKRLRGPMLGPDALRVGRQIASALAAAHQKGIIHRDLKPDNVIVVPDSEAASGERAKVLDFGIAKITQDSEGKAVQGMTQMGEVMGTPRYMSPEQCKGSARVDAKTDVYALGVIIFQMLTGKPPFDAEGPGALMAMQIYQEPPSLRSIEPMVMPNAEKLVLSMLAKDPAQRPTMPEVVQQLEMLGAHGSAMTSALPAIRIPQGYQSQSAMQAINAPMAIDSSGPNVASRPSLMGVGQTQDPTRLKSASGIKRLLVPALMATVLSGIGIAVVMRTTTTEPRIEKRPARPTAPVKSVKWEVKSEPTAEIVRVSDGVVLGMTPWTKDQPVGIGKMGVTLRRSGYIDKQVLLDLEKDTAESVVLDKVPGAAEPTGNEPTGVKPAKKSKKPKTAKEARKDDDSDLLTPVH